MYTPLKFSRSFKKPRFCTYPDFFPSLCSKECWLRFVVQLENRPIDLLRDISRGRFTKLVASLHPGCHQVPNKTSFDRYPEIFGAAARAAPDARQILSFGCSTGEECVTLARYFPAAQIVGTDINPLNLLKARRHRSERIRFVYASDRILSGLDGFDAVFCMAVLRTWKRNVADHYPFDRFAERALFLESLVRPGGILVVHNGSYRFGDTTQRFAYESIPVAAPYDKVYLPDGVTEAKPEGCIFRKREPSAPDSIQRPDTHVLVQLTAAWRALVKKRAQARIESSAPFGGNEAGRKGAGPSNNAGIDLGDKRNGADQSRGRP